MAIGAAPPASTSLKDVPQLAEEIEQARLELQRRAHAAPSTEAQKVILDLVSLPGDLLDGAVLKTLAEPSEEPAQRAARLAWMRWADGYLTALRDSITTIEGANHPIDERRSTFAQGGDDAVDYRGDDEADVANGSEVDESTQPG